MDNESRKEKRASWNIRPYLAMGLTAFIVLASSIVLYFMIDRYHGASDSIKAILQILQPILIGAIIAYLLNPLVNKIQLWLVKYADKKGSKWKLLKRMSRGLGVTMAMLILLLFFVIFFRLLGPQLYETVEGLVETLPKQTRETSVWLQEMLSKNETIAKYVNKGLTEGANYFEQWLKTDVLPQSKEIIGSVTSGIIVFAKGLINFVIGLIVCIYVLMDKDHFVGAAKKLTYGLFPTKTGNVIIKTARKSHMIFVGFIVGKIIDSIIIGILCYIVLIIFHIPYALLVSFIVGVTNVVPVFGPYVGAVPSFLLILLADPMKALYFLIIILVIQQLDGNIIGPKILGESTGLSSFWVIFAILLGGGLFGFIGMLFGVPTFAVIYYIVNEILKYLLRKRDLPQEAKDFIEVDKLDEETHKVIYKEKDIV